MSQPIVTIPKTYCFVLMPFTEAFDDIYLLGIKAACTNAGAYCERVDEQIFRERILDRIYNQIAKADLVIADMTDRNPNVFYEVGYAHALGKLTILLTQNADDIPFDLKHFPHIVYGKKISNLRDELEKRVKYFIENPPTDPSDTKVDLELFLAGESLASAKAVHQFRPGYMVDPEITVFNASSNTFSPGDFKIGILTSERFPSSPNVNVVTTRLPSGGYIHMLPDFPLLLPNGYASFHVFLEESIEGFLGAGDEEIITVRLFTKQGSRDFPLTISESINS